MDEDRHCWCCRSAGREATERELRSIIHSGPFLFYYYYHRTGFLDSIHCWLMSATPFRHTTHRKRPAASITDTFGGRNFQKKDNVDGQTPKSICHTTSAVHIFDRRIRSHHQWHNGPDAECSATWKVFPSKTKRKPNKRDFSCPRYSTLFWLIRLAFKFKWNYLTGSINARLSLP